MDKVIHADGIAAVAEEGHILAGHIEVADHVVAITDRKIILVPMDLGMGYFGLKSQGWTNRSEDHNQGQQKGIR